MVGMGTVANVAAILGGGALGLLFRGGLREGLQQAVIRVLGLAVILIGLSGALVGLVEVQGGQLSSAGVSATLKMIFALVLGTLTGEAIDLEKRLEQLGDWLKRRATRGEDSRFVQGFVTTSLVVCVGAMAIVGAIQDGLMGDPSLLYTKSILDCMIVMVFASTYGKGALFSALPVGVLQGSVTLAAGALGAVFQDPAIQQNLSFTGAILILCVGLNLALESRFRVANMLPAMVFGAVFTQLP